MKSFKQIRIATFLMAAVLFITINAHAQWSAPVVLSMGPDTATINESMGTCIGVSNDTVHVIWSDKRNNSHAAIYYSRSIDAGLTWSVPVSITNTVVGNAWNPAIAVNGQNIHVAWREIDTITFHRASWYKHSLDGGNTWSQSMYLDSTADWPAISVSGANVYIANDRVVSQNPYNTEIFFMRSVDNGNTWGAAQQLTFAVGRSEDEGISAQGSHIHMAWNDNRIGKFQILYKESSDYGVTWGPDKVVIDTVDYNTMVSIDNNHVDVIATGAPTGHNQLQIAQSADTGATWAPSMDLSNDTAHGYFLPDMVRDSCKLHVLVNSNGGGKYFHSADGGTTWDPPVAMPGCMFIAYSGDVLHVIYVNSAKVKYLRNPTGNGGPYCPLILGEPETNTRTSVSIYPNPSNGIFTLKGELGIRNYELGIFDVMGREVYHQLINQSTPSTIDISNCSNGVYFYQLTNGEETVRGKLVKD